MQRSRVLALILLAALAHPARAGTGTGDPGPEAPPAGTRAPGLAAQGSTDEDASGDRPAPLVEFVNGDRLHGDLVTLRKGVVTFSAFRSSLIDADLTDVRDITTADAYEVGLADGSLVIGALRPTGEAGTLALATAQGSVVVPRDQLVGIDPVGTRAAKAAAEATRIAKANRATWSGFGEVAITESTGNTELSNVKVSAEAIRKSPDDRFRLKLFANEARNQQRLTAQRASGEARMDWFLEDDWFWFAQGLLETDELRSLDLRTTLGVGIGRKHRGPRNLQLDVGLGFSFVREAFASGRDNSEASMLVTLDFARDLSRNLSFAESVVAYPQPDGDFRLTSDTTLKSKITDKLSMVVGLLLKHDTDPQPGIEPTDFTVTTGLRRDF